MQVPRLSSALGALLLFAGPASAQPVPPRAASAQQAFLSVFAQPGSAAPSLGAAFDPAATMRLPPRAEVRVANPAWRQSLAGWSGLWPRLPLEDAAQRIAGAAPRRVWIANVGVLSRLATDPAPPVVPDWFLAPPAAPPADARLLRGFADSGAHDAAIPVHLVWLGADDPGPETGGAGPGRFAGPLAPPGSGWGPAEPAARALPRRDAGAPPALPGWIIAGPDTRLSAWLADLAPPRAALDVGPPAGLAARAALVAAPVAVMAGLRARF
jgi:hypothetical protein